MEGHARFRQEPNFLYLTAGAYTLVPISAQLELTLPLSAQLKLALSPTRPKLPRGCGPKVLKVSSNVSDVFPKVLKLSSEVSECKPLPDGRDGAGVRRAVRHGRRRAVRAGGAAAGAYTRPLVSST